MTRVRPLCWGAAFAWLASLPTLAQAQIYRCESNGVVELSNSPASGRDARCRAIDLPDVNTIPVPKLSSQPSAAPRPGPSASAAPTPAGFPRVDPGAQRARDTDRRRILEDELRKEEMRLAELRTALGAAAPERNDPKHLDRVQRVKDDISRTESSVASLRREMAALRE